jgi:uncharacterized membrane protein YqjE
MVASLRRMGGGYMALARQRLEIAALDVEEELLRFGSLLAALLALVALASLALAAAAATLVVLFWDSARIGVLVGVVVAFAAATAAVAWWLRESLRAKPPFLATTLDELGKDIQELAGPT